MMCTSDPQPSTFYHINLEQFVAAEHPMRRIQPLIGTSRIRTLCEPLYPRWGTRRFRLSSSFWRS